MKINMALVGCVLAAVVLFPGPLWAEDPVAPLNGVAEFDENTGLYVLKVDTKGKTIKADSFEILQGDPDTQYTIDGTAGTGDANDHKPVGSVAKEAGSVLYRVSGTYVGGGGGGGGGGGDPKRWTADYDYGGRRMVLWVNSSSASDDFVGLGAEGAVTVMLPFSDDGNTYTIQLRDGNGPGTIEFFDANADDWKSTVNIELGEVESEWTPSLSVRIKGHTEGSDQIHAANNGVSEGGTLLDPNWVAANCPVVRVTVKSVAIKAANDPNALTVYSDDEGEDVGIEPEWDDQGRREAAAFVRAADPNGSIKFKVTLKGPPGETAKVWAMDGETVVVEENEDVDFDDDGNAIDVEFSVVPKVGNVVDLKEWQWTWQYKIGEAPPVNTTLTEHRVYVVLADPNGTPRDSYYYIGCSFCKGKNVQDADALWTAVCDGFSELTTTNARNVLLGYYAKMAQATTEEEVDKYITDKIPKSAEGLVVSGDGDCKAWARLAAFVCEAHNVNAGITCVRADPDKLKCGFPPTPPIQPAVSFMVRGWNWDETGGAPPASRHPFLWRLDPTRPKSAGWYWAETDVSEDGSLKAQGMGGGRKGIAHWGHHWITHYNAANGRKYCDTAYGGERVGSIVQWEDKALGLGLANPGGYALDIGSPPKYSAQEDKAGQQVHVTLVENEQ